ncbi:MAG: hypothetical protein ACOC7V_16465 [Spirochaetota bacterium]
MKPMRLKMISCEVFAREANYLRRPLPADDPHGLPTVLYGCLGAELTGGDG